jgi:hypothetical protein
MNLTVRLNHIIIKINIIVSVKDYECKSYIILSLRQQLKFTSFGLIIIIYVNCSIVHNAEIRSI